MRTLALAPVLLAVATPAAAQHLTMPSPPGFVLGYEGRQGANLVREFVPRGQTVRNYTRMISSHRLARMGGVPEKTFAIEWAKRYLRSCPGATPAAVPFGTRAAGIRIDCRRHPATGRPETVIARAVHGGPDMFLVFVTFRYLPMPREAQWARDQLAAVVITR